MKVSVDIRASLAEVWDRVAHLEGHVEWMREARSIRFLGERRSGVGTRMEVETRLGPLRTRDLIEISAWEPLRRIGVLHAGAVTGRGEILLEPLPGGSTRLTWEEELRFPWWLGGRLGERLADPWLRRMWRADLERLRQSLAP